jgi:hypothetical protein
MVVTEKHLLQAFKYLEDYAEMLDKFEHSKVSEVKEFISQFYEEQINKVAIICKPLTDEEIECSTRFNNN